MFVIFNIDIVMLFGDFIFHSFFIFFIFKCLFRLDNGNLQLFNYTNLILPAITRK
jgi:hypothetical protein